MAKNPQPPTKLIPVEAAPEPTVQRVIMRGRIAVFYNPARIKSETLEQVFGQMFPDVMLVHVAVENQPETVIAINIPS